MQQSKIDSTQKDDILCTQRHQLHDATNAGVTFLLEARDHQDCWKDYDLVVTRMGDEWTATAGDEWVTAYTGSVLATVPDARVSEAIMGAWNLLKTTSRPIGGWGYNSISKPDASSTSWALQLAEAVGAGDSEQAQLAKAFLNTHQRSNGGIAAYATEERVRDFFKTPPHISVEGTLQAHTCVSAEVAALPEYRFRLRNCFLPITLQIAT